MKKHSLTSSGAGRKTNDYRRTQKQNRQLMERIRGGRNGHIEQITYLMFIHALDEADTRRVRDNLMLGLPYDSLFDGEYQIGEKTIEKNQLRWSKLLDFPAGRQFELMQECSCTVRKQATENKR